MAKERDPWAKFREKDERRVQDENERLHEEMRKFDPEAKLGEATSSDRVLVDLLAKCETLMEQITNLYAMWIQGFERAPPNQPRRHLDDLVLKIQAAPKPTTNLRFRVNEFQAKYRTFVEKWERTAKDVETGKIVVKRKSVSG